MTLLFLSHIQQFSYMLLPLPTTLFLKKITHLDLLHLVIDSLIITL